MRTARYLSAALALAVSLSAGTAGGQRALAATLDLGGGVHLPDPPSVSTDPPTEVTQTAATLNGTVDPNGEPTSYHFEYGATPLYGSSTPAQSAGAGSANVAVSQAVSSLPADSVVHYRLVATNADGTATGLDRILITLAGPPVRAPGPPLTAIGLPGDTTTPAVGKPTKLSVGGRDSRTPVAGVAVDFGEAGNVFAESACRLRPHPHSGAFGNGANTVFGIPYTFQTPGLRQLQVTLTSGGCGHARGTTQTLQVSPQKMDVARLDAATLAATAPAVAAGGCRGANLVPSRRNLRTVTRATLCLLNQQRRANGLGPLRSNRKLAKAAKIHTGYMLRGHFFAHQGPGEPALGSRFRIARYAGGGGENLGEGAGVPYSTPAGMVSAWMQSPVHRANILERSFHTIGIAIAAAKPVPPPPVPGATYTTEFGTTRR